MPLFDNLRGVLEHSPNGYIFRYRCKGLRIIIEKQPDNDIVAYYSDVRDGSITIDATQRSFGKIVRLY